MGNYVHLLRDIRKQNILPSKKILEHGHYGYMWMAVKTKKIVASHIIYNILEIEPYAEFLNAEKWRKYVHPQDLYKLLQAEEKLMSTGESVSVEYRMITKSNRLIFVNHLMQISASYENELKVLSMLDDVTEQKRADTILEVMNESFFELDKNFRFRRINAKAELFWQVNRNSLVDRPFMKVFPEADGTEFYNLLVKATAEKTNHAQDVICPVTARWLHVSASPYSDGIIVVFYDIHNEKTAEEKIRHSEESWRTLVENTPDVITRWNKDLKLVFANIALEAKTGVPNKTLLGKNSSEMGQPDEIALPWMDSLRKVFEMGEAVEHYNSFPTPDGIVQFYSRIVPEKNANGEVKTALAIARDITELKKSQREIKESKELLQSIFDGVQSSIMVNKIIYDKENKAEDFEIIMFNQFMYKITGTNSDIVGKRYSEVFPVVKQNGVLDEFKKVADTGEPVKFEQLFTGERMSNWLYFNISKVDSLLVVITEDTTEHRKTEKEIKESKELLQSVWDTSLIQMSVLKAVRDEKNDIIDFEIILVNKELEKLTGRTDLIGKLFSEEYPGIKQTGLFNALVRVVEIGHPEKLEYFYPYEGINKWISSMFVKLGDGVVSTSLDITERKKAEEDKFKNFTLLKQSEELAEAGSWDYDTATKEFCWSDGMYSLFSLEKGTRVEPTIYLDYVIPEDRELAQQLVGNIQNNFKSSGTILRIKPDGIIKTIKIKAVPLKSDEGVIKKMLGVDIDITAAKVAEEKIHQLNQALSTKNRELLSLNSELKTFNSIAANDYRETFRHLYTNLEFIISHDAANLSDVGKANVRRAQTAIQKMKLLTDDIVAFSKISMLENETLAVDLNEILQTVLTDLYEKLNEAYAKIERDSLPVIEGFPLLLSLLFHHLLENAVKFKSENAAPQISIQYSKVEGIHFNHGLNGDTTYHKISFADNGIGFEQKQSEKIFTIFYRLHEKGRYKGSGVGLAICKKIMYLHGGFITAESEPLKGATFNCFFPFKPLTQKH